MQETFTLLLSTIVTKIRRRAWLELEVLALRPARRFRPRQIVTQGNPHMNSRDTIRPVMTFFMLCCAVSYASGTAAADRKSTADLIGNKTPTQDINPVFDRIDENKDQRIDRIEFRVWIVSAFDTLDANKDNGLGRNVKKPACSSTVAMLEVPDGCTSSSSSKVGRTCSVSFGKTGHIASCFRNDRCERSPEL